MNTLRWTIFGALAGVALIASACVFVADKPHALERRGAQHVTSPVKAHLRNGSVVLFPHGFDLRHNYLFGSLEAYGLARKPIYVPDSIAVDSVIFLEYYRYNPDPGAFLATLPGVAAATAGLAVAIFGSCPTIYTQTDSSETLEAECFSYSIAPRLEGDDLDRLDYGAPRDGRYTLKVANEAYETHYINSLRLLAVDHDAACEPFPTPQEKVVLFGKETPFISARDFAGRDVSSILGKRDDQSLQSDASAIAALAAGQEMEDGMVLEVAVPEGARRMVLACRVRTSFMNTVFFYEQMLGSQGLGALDWMRPSPGDLYRNWRLFKWYSRNFGLRVQIARGGSFKDAANIVNVGPIAWRSVAVDLPAPPDKVARLRLASLPGNWIVDWIGVSFDPSQQMAVTEISPSELRSLSGTGSAQLAEMLKRDREHFVTFPGDQYLVGFNLPPVAENGTRSYFLKSRGYYIEWLRQSWIAQSQSDSADPVFQMGRPVLQRTAQKWLAQRADYERHFYASRLGASKGETP